jgi:hypothetical protein
MRALMRIAEFLRNRVGREDSRDLNASEAKSIADAVIGEVVIFHKFAFPTGILLHAEEQALLCVQKNVAVAAHASDGTLLVDRRIKRSHDRLQGLTDDVERVTNRGPRALPGFLLRHPLLAIRLIRSLRKSEKLEPEGEREHESVGDVLSGVNYSLVEPVILEHLAAAVDCENVRAAVLSERRWCRLTLPAFTCQVDNDSFGVDVALLLHSSGAAIVTFIVVRQEITCRSANAASFAINPQFSGFDLPREIVDAAFSRSGGTLPPIDASGSHEAPNGMRFSLEDVFVWYRAAILHSISPGKAVAGTEEWVHYPLFSVRDAEDDQADAVGRLLAIRFPSYNLPEHFSPSVEKWVCNPMNSLTGRMFVSAGASVHVIHKHHRDELVQKFGTRESVPGQEWAWTEYSAALPIELALIRLTTLKVISMLTRNASRGSGTRLAIEQLLIQHDIVSHERYLMSGELLDVELALLECHNYQAQFSGVLRQLELYTGLEKARVEEAGRKAVSRLEWSILLFTVVLGLLGPIAALLQVKTIDDRMPSLFDKPFSVWGEFVLRFALLCIIAISAFGLVTTAVLRLSRWVTSRRRKLAHAEGPPKRGLHPIAVRAIHSPLRWTETDHRSTGTTQGPSEADPGTSSG